MVETTNTMVETTNTMVLTAETTLINVKKTVSVAPTIACEVLSVGFYYRRLDSKHNQLGK
jgi:hypothetical protein